MSHSQFTSAKLEAHAQGKQGFQQITATGPLEGIDLTKYEPPFVIHVTIIQNPENDHKPIHARRAVGYTTIDAEGDWVAKIDAPTGLFESNREARGIAVAVLARTEGYTSEVLTWCDHIPKLDGTPSPDVRAE